MTRPGVEHRLHDLFATIDSQTETPPRRRSPGAAPRGVGARRVLVAAAAVILVAALAVLLVSRDGDQRTDVAAGPEGRSTAAAFDERMGAVCAELDRARAGVEPRFATVEAYRVVAEARAAALAAAVAVLVAVPPPEDDPAVATRAVGELRSAEERLADVRRATTLGDVEAAAGAWAEVDPAIDRALGALGEHGAVPCRR
jgi:hypothetical protein